MAPTSMPDAATPPVASGTLTIPRGMSELLTVPIAQVDVESNVRTDLGDLEELAASIKSEGLLQPIHVHRGGMRPDSHGFTVDHGHRRLAACKLAGLTEIPVIVGPERVGVSRPIAQLVENLQRRDLGPLEEAEAFRAILTADPKLTQVVLAGRIGRSAPYVSNALRILELEPAVADRVRSGLLSGAHAKTLAGLKPAQQVEYLGVAMSSSSHALEDRIARDREWKQEQAAASASTSVDHKKHVDAMVAAATKTVGAGQPIHVTDFGYGNLGKAIAKGLTAAGFAIAEGGPLWNRDQVVDCDCKVWRVICNYSGSPSLKPACHDKAHYDAKGAAETATYQAKQAAERHVQDLVAERVRSEVRDLPEFTARLVAYELGSWRLIDWADARAKARGLEKAKNVWDELSEAGPAELEVLLSDQVSKQVTSGSGLPLDKLRDMLEPPAPISAVEAAERVTAKRAERRAGVASCRVCGCTNARACVGGCAWVETDLCSACAS